MNLPDFETHDNLIDGLDPAKKASQLAVLSSAGRQLSNLLSVNKTELSRHRASLAPRGRHRARCFDFSQRRLSLFNSSRVDSHGFQSVAYLLDYSLWNCVYWSVFETFGKQLCVAKINRMTCTLLFVVLWFLEFKIMKAFTFMSFLVFCLLVLSDRADAQTPSNDARSGAELVAKAETPFQQKDERYRIGYQDKLDIQIFRHPELAQSVNVNSNGTINLFRIPTPVMAVCKTERELANDVAEAYKKDYLRNPEVNVVASEQRSQAFAVIGAVEKPGSYFINRRIHLLELLAQAGGPSKEAGSRILVARTGSTSSCKAGDFVAPVSDDIALLDFKISDVLEAKQNLVMQPGDIVSVMDADVVYVYGNVNKQGQVTIKEPITLTQAIASAEGLKPSSKSRVRILRQKANSLEREEFVFDLSKINKRETQDPYLEPNDVVAVSEDAAKGILRSIGRSITGGLPTIFYRIPVR